MRRLLVATTNPHKVREIRTLLAVAPVEIVGLDQLPGIREPEETGRTFDANARLKAQYYAAAAAQRQARIDLTVAEDSGLVIDALEGAPGVESARFLGADATYPERFAEIFRRLDAHPDRPRTARFVCALAVADAHGRIVFETTGRVEGRIAREARGTAGFGYDPIFYYPPYGRTLAEVDEEAKLHVAHRGHAFRALERWLEERGTEKPE